MSGNDKIVPVVDANSFAMTGLTKREYFAACALQGLCAVPMKDGDLRNDCAAAVIFADALIAALSAVKS